MLKQRKKCLKLYGSIKTQTMRVVYSTWPQLCPHSILSYIFKHEGAAIRRFLSTWLNSQIKFSERKKNPGLHLHLQTLKRSVMYVTQYVIHLNMLWMELIFFSFNSFAIYHNPLKPRYISCHSEYKSHHLPVIIKWSMCKEDHFDGRTTNTKDNILVGLMHEKKSLKR